VLSDPIGEFLAAVRARLSTRRRWAGLVTLVAATGGGVLLVLVGGALFPSAAWRALAVSGALAGGFVTWLRGARARAAWSSDEAVARFVGGDDLLSAVELGRELPRLDADPVLSAQLVRALRANVAARLSSLRPAALVDLAPLRRGAWRAIGGVAAAWVALLWLWPAGLARGWDDLWKGRDERAATSTEPIVADLKLELIPPAYTGLPPRVIPATSGQILALPGTVVKIEARALSNAHDRALLVVEEDGQARQTRPVEVRGPVLHASFTVKRAGSYHFVLGRVREPESHRIEIDPDRAPRVDLFAPGDPLEVAGPRRIELAYTVDDDYGLGDVELVWKIGEGPEARRVVVPAEPGQRAATGKLEWDLAELDLKPGARVAYHLEAKDNDTVSGPNVGKSRTMYLSIFSPREKHEAAVAAEEQLLEQALALLADRLELARDEAGLVEALTPIHSRAEAFLVALTRAEQAAETESKTGDAQKQLREMHGRLQKLTRDEEQALGEARHKKAKPRALSTGNALHVTELERDVLVLDDLLGRQKLEELLALGDEMTQARDRLKQLLAEYKKTRSEALKKEIEREMRELERKLAELRAKSSRLASEMPDQFLNPEAMGKNDLGQRLDKMKDLLARGDVDAAMAELERLSSSLDKMMASMEGNLRGYRRERFSAEEKQLAEIEDKVSDLEHDEKQLKNETEGIRQRTRAEAQRQMRDKVEPFVKRAREKVAQVKKHADAVEKSVMSPFEQEELQHIRQRVADLDKMLAEGDLEEALGAARLAQAALRSLGSDLQDDEDRAWRGAKPAVKRSREHVGEGEKLARQIADEIQDVMPRPDQLMSPEDQQKMLELGQRQAATKRRTSELMRELERRGADGKPMAAPPQLGEGLKQAGDHMERAEGRLSRHDARDASGEESQAIDKLGQLKQQIQEQRRPREQMANGRLDKEPVKIPGADEYRAPREFRQDLLEAMKRGAPPEYKEQVKRYYEELVK
jgi:hypothetical protein